MAAGLPNPRTCAVLLGAIALACAAQPSPNNPAADGGAETASAEGAGGQGLEIEADAPLADAPTPAEFTCPDCPCQTDGECGAGLCADSAASATGKACGLFFAGTCPSGYVVSASAKGKTCVPESPKLCNPCAADSDCLSTGGDGLCVGGGVFGRFCGIACPSTGCPTGYKCVSTQGTSGITAKQCVPISGTCNCSAAAVGLQLATPCPFTNAFGTCVGKRTCAAAGLTDCIGQVPQPEACNGKDDNCNGLTDEGQLCDDFNPCSNDGCKPPGVCTHSKFADGKPCNDDTPCTVNDHCINGYCGGQLLNCASDNPCVKGTCELSIGCVKVPVTGPIDDGDPCTVGEKCQGEAFVAGKALTCNDKNPCTQDSCVKGKGCLFVDLPSGATCSDANPCTVGDQCSDGACLPGPATSCDDGNVCTKDSCDKKFGCVQKSTWQPCDDGNSCTVGDKCDYDGACLPSDVTTCDDNKPCTQDWCDPAKGCQFVALPSGSSCSDGKP